MEIIDTNFDYGPMTPRNVNNIDLIILHHAAASNCSAEDIHNWHKARGWAGIGYNFLVRKDGSVYRCRPMEYVPAHCTGYNTRSIGICFEGDFMWEWMEDTQINAGKELVAMLKSQYGISDTGVHKWYQATDCPGDNFPIDEIINGQPTPGPVPPPTPPQNERVAVAQRWLTSKGYWTADDGIAGPISMSNCVKLYQKCIGTTADGIYGPKTYDASWRTISKGESGTIVGTIQCMLIFKGYELALDEDFGNDTEFTLNGYQHDIGMEIPEEDYGKLTQDTSAQLFT